jgi:hypothetical protein
VTSVPDEASVIAGGNRTTRIWISNTGSSAIGEVRPYFVGDGAEFFTLMPASFTIDYRGSKTADLIIEVPNGTTPKDYTVSFQLRTGSNTIYSKTIKLSVVEVRENRPAPENQTLAESNGTTTVLASITGMFASPASVSVLYGGVAAAIALGAYAIKTRLGSVLRPNKKRKSNSYPPWQGTIDSIMRGPKRRHR